MDTNNYTFDKPFVAGQNLIIPKSLKLLARHELKVLSGNSSNDNINFKKASNLLESFLERNTVNQKTGQMPAYGLCSTISAKPFWMASDASLLESFEKDLLSNLEVIRCEYHAALKAKGYSLTQSIKTGERSLGKGAWRNFTLGNLGRYYLEAKNMFPRTIELLEPYKNRIFSAEIIVMEPDTVLPPHTDATNAYLVAHLGLEVPQNCGLQVKKEIRDFHQDDLIFFDQSFAHSAWNKGESPRANLLIAFFHPEINDDEIDMLLLFIKKLKKKALLLSPIIALEYFFLKSLALIKNIY